MMPVGRRPPTLLLKSVKGQKETVPETNARGVGIAGFEGSKRRTQLKPRAEEYYTLVVTMVSLLAPLP